MKKLLRNSLAVLLTAIICLSAFAPALAADGEAVPTVYVAGQGCRLVADKTDSSSKTIYPIDINLDYIKGVIKELNPVFAKAYITGDYDEYCNVICNAVDPVFAEVRLDKNGLASNGSGTTWKWSRDTLKDKKIDGEYGLFAYEFWYDWRADPCDNADSLNAYIDDVMYVTGASKVNIVSRCLGCNNVLAYLAEYGSSKVAKCVFYCATLEGTASCSKTFSGQIVVEADGVERFVYDYLGDDLLMEFIKASVSLLNKTHGLDLLLDFVNDVYGKVKDNIVPRLLRLTYGTFPAYWSMIGKDDYELARNVVFAGTGDEYAGLISRINHYHNNVQGKAREILDKAQKSGTSIAIIAKYGYQLVPVVPNTKDVADSTVELTLASLGATTSQIDKTLGKEYLSAAKAKGTYKYISSDKQVDASTCLFPDYTWIIKGISHKNFPASIDELINTFLAFDGQMTINDDSRFPQYMVFDEKNGTVSPMTEENCGVTNWSSDNIFTIVAKFFKLLAEVIKQYLIPLIKEQMPKL